MARNGGIGAPVSEFVKAFLESETNEQVAQKLGITVQSVTTRASMLRDKGYPLPSRQRGASGRQAQGIDDSILRMIVDNSNKDKTPEEREVLFQAAKVKALEDYAKSREGKKTEPKRLTQTELDKVSDGGFSDPNIKVDGINIPSDVLTNSPEVAVAAAKLAEAKAHEQVVHAESELVQAAAQSTPAPQKGKGGNAKKAG